MLQLHRLINNGGDNPPGYNPDIINNQLITTFGTTTAPDDFAFGSVNVRPVPQQHLEHTFNTTDLTQEAIERAIDDAPGLDVHTVGISQEQIVGDGAPINESTLTIINWGKYRLRTLGLHQIATADNSNNWVVPALMEVSIPLIQNQVIDHTGTYHIVQRTVNGQTGLVIEEYIPEPETEEVLQNNSNTRAMIIDEEENNENNEEINNNGQMVLRGQNNVRGLPDSTGETIEGTFEINIPPTPTSNVLYMDYFYVSASEKSLPGDSNAEICTRERWNATSQTSISIPSKCTLILVYNNYPSSSEYISFSVLANNNSTSANVNLYSGGYYYITGAKSTAYIWLHIRSTDSNTDLGEITFCDPTRNDTSYYQMYLNKNHYTVDFSN